MSLFPYAGAHAVQSAAFALEWPIELSDSELSVVLNSHEKLRTSLPQMTPLHTMMFQMATGQQPGSATNVIGGYAFSRHGATGPARTLEVQRNRIVGQVNDYTRWKPVWQEVKNWLSVVGPALGQRQITQVGLQYNDIFYWRGNPQSLDLKQIFSESTSLLPKNVFDLKGLWHSHNGYFLENTEPIQHRLLENINVNMLEELGQRSIVISTVHKANVTNIWGWENLEKEIETLMDHLHKRNKAALKELLSENAAKSIGLFEENT